MIEIHCIEMTAIIVVCCCQSTGFQTVNPPSSISQPECHKQYSACKTWKQAACLAHTLQHSNGGKDWWMPNKTVKISNSTHSTWISGVIKWGKVYSFKFWTQTQIIVYSTSQHRATRWGQTESLWDCNYRRFGLELSAICGHSRFFLVTTVSCICYSH